MDKKIALVTGGSGGIGVATIERLTKAGMYVYFTYSGNIQKANEIENTYPQAVKAIKFDARNDDASEVLQMIKDEQGQIDVLVNNLGITNDKLLVQMKENDFTDVINVNLNSTYAFTKAALKMMSRKKYGRIINISSVVGVSGNIGQANYAASKGAIIAFTKSVAKEYARKGITVNSVSPGFVNTAMTDGLPDNVKEAFLANIAIGRYAEPIEVANVINFLASDEASYVTSQNLIVDGGMI